MRIWVTQGFSLRPLAAAMVAARPAVDFLFSAADPEAGVRDVAPAFRVEPATLDETYPEWVLAQARADAVDIVVPLRGRTRLAAALQDFTDAGIMLSVAADAATLDLLDDKAAFVADLAGDPHLCPSIAVDGVAACREAIEALTADGAAACVKPRRGVYGAGYWTLDATDPFHHLSDPDARRITPAAYLDALGEAEAVGRPIALLVMEHLPGIEASIDIVASHGQVLLAAAREKLAPSRQRIRTDHPAIDHAHMLVARYRLHGALNVQYKRDRTGAWKVLEINTRPAGGAAYLEAVGIPYAATWVDAICGRGSPWAGKTDREVVSVTRAEPRRAGLMIDPNSSCAATGEGLRGFIDAD